MTEEQEHESYGVIRLGRPRGGKLKMFGSPLLVSEHITFTVKRATRKHELSSDWIFGRGAPVIEIAMTHSQLSELLFGNGRNDGVPCTIRSVEGKRMEPPPEAQSELQLILENHQESLSSLDEKLKKLRDDVQEVLSKGVSKKKRDAIESLFLRAVTHTKSNAAFGARRFAEVTQEITDIAKQEMSYFVERYMVRFGEDAIKQMFDVNPRATLPALGSEGVNEGEDG